MSPNIKIVSMSSNVYLFVISSLNHPIYRQVQMKRRHLLRHYNIPYTVLINHDESSLDDKKVPTLVPIHEDEILYNGAGYNPYMAQKFLSAVKMLFRSYSHYDDIPNYIIRINATVYIHYPSLLKVLNDKKFPKERVLAGLNWGNVFVQGMVMVFSKDVLANMLQDPNIYSKQIMKDNDDVSLSVLADPYSTWIDWNVHSCWYQRICPRDKNGKYLLEIIQPKENDIWIFRICEHENNRNMDLVNWDLLLKYFQEYDIVSQHPTTTFDPLPYYQHLFQNQHTPRNSRYVWILFFVVILFLVVLMTTEKKRKLKMVYDKIRKFVLDPVIKK